MTLATAWMAFHELTMMKAREPEEFATALRWVHVPTWLNFLAVTGFVLIHLQAGRRWLAVLAIGLRSVSLLVNFTVHPNINFQEITALRGVMFPGDQTNQPLTIILSHAEAAQKLLEQAPPISVS